MHPYRCAYGPKQIVCQLPYPYELKNPINLIGLAGLEDRLLF